VDGKGRIVSNLPAWMIQKINNNSKKSDNENENENGEKEKTIGEILL